jgi:hypothetical protein
MLGVGDDPRQQWGLQLALECVTQVGYFQRQMPRAWTELGAPGSDLDRLVRDLPDGPIDLRQTVWEGLWTAWTCLDQVAEFAKGERSSSPQVTMILLRSALMAAARVVYAVAPHARPSRRDRALTVMQQEGKSLLRLYKEADTFSSPIANLPPQDQRDAQRHAAEALLAGSKQIVEAELLKEMARVSVELLNAERADSETHGPMDAVGERDELLWVFNVYSGVAHGFAWPTVMWTIGSYPTNFVSDLWLVAMIADRAHQLVMEASDINSPDILTANPIEVATRGGQAPNFSIPPSASAAAEPGSRTQPRSATRASRRRKKH